MKKIKRWYVIVLILICGIHSLGFSQFISKGSIIGNGSVSYNSIKKGEDYSTQFSFLPWAGFFITDNFVLGAGIDFESSSSKGSVTVYSGSTSGPQQKMSYEYFTRGVAMGPVVRYYFNGGLFLHSQYSVGIQRFNRYGWIYANPSDYNLHVFKGGAGYAFKISKRILLEPLVGFKSLITTDRITKVESHSRGYFFLISFTLLLKNNS